MTTANETYRKHYFIDGVVVISLFLLALYRAVTLDFTNDEAFSFLNVDKVDIHMMCGTANTHWLTTFFMYAINNTIGHAEWALRLPSVIAVCFFAWFSIRSFRLLNSSFLILIPITLLVLNHYLFDYFSLARGYALSMMFETMAFYFIICDQQKHALKIYLCLSLATFSNYTCIYILYAYFIIECWHLIQLRKFQQIFKWSFYKHKWPMILISIWSIPNILFIKYVTNDLREGDKNGFVQDTLSVFFERSVAFLPQKTTLFICGILFLMIILFYLFYRNKMRQGFKTLIEILLINFLMIQVFYTVLNIPYPYGRTAFFYIIPFLFVVAYMLIYFIEKLPRYVSFIFVSMLFSLNMFYIIDVRNWQVTIEYWKQQGIDECMQDLYAIEKNNIKHIRVGMSIDHYGSFLNYYKYLNPTHFPDTCFVYSRDGYQHMTDQEIAQFARQDYLLMLEDYHSFLESHIPADRMHVVKHYPEMQTDLIKLN